MSMMVERDMGRILLDLSDEVIKRLDILKQQRNLPRAELLREAVEQYLEKQSQAEFTISGALGIWQECESTAGVRHEAARCHYSGYCACSSPRTGDAQYQGFCGTTGRYFTLCAVNRAEYTARFNAGNYSPSPGNRNGLIELRANPSCSIRASSTNEARSSATASTFGSFS